MMQCSISEDEHALLRNEVKKVITGLEERHLEGYPKISQLNMLARLIKKQSFGAAIDGLNVKQVR